MTTQITKKEFRKRVKENTAEYIRQRTHNIFDLKRYHGADVEKGLLADIVLAKKSHDIIGAIVLGFLPYLKETTGHDALKLEDNKFKFVELKTTYTDQDKFIKTENNAIYSVTQDLIVNNSIPKNNSTSLKSNFQATYTIKGNLDSKGIDTYLLVFDSKDGMLICVHEMKDNVIKKYLDDRKIPESGSVTIKLTTFEKLGTPYEKSVIPAIGLDIWKENMLKNLRVVHIISLPRKKKVIEPTLLNTSSLVLHSQA